MRTLQGGTLADGSSEGVSGHGESQKNDSGEVHEGISDRAGVNDTAVRPNFARPYRWSRQPSCP